MSVTEQLLHRANVGTGLQQVRGEAVTQGVRRHVLVDPGERSRTAQRPRQAFLEQVVAPSHADPRIDGSVGEGNTQCHDHDSPLRGYFAASASGTNTPASWATRSASHSRRERASCSGKG